LDIGNPTPGTPDRYFRSSDLIFTFGFTYASLVEAANVLRFYQVVPSTTRDDKSALMRDVTALLMRRGFLAKERLKVT